MDYQTALKAFSYEGIGAKLTSSEFSKLLKSNLDGPDRSNPHFMKAFSVKRISGDLDRLYKMGFMKRKRKKRTVYASIAEALPRGFEYQYQISEQGWQYLNFISNRNTRRRPTSQSLPELLKSLQIDSLLPKDPGRFSDLLDNVFEIRGFEDRGRHKRFPTEKTWMLLRELERKDREIDYLRKQVILTYPKIAPWGNFLPSSF